MIPITKDNFTLQWNPVIDESYIKIVGIDSMARDVLIKQILDYHYKWNTLMTHTRYHNTFGCQYHHRVQHEIPELNRKNQFLQSEIVDLKNRIHYTDIGFKQLEEEKEKIIMENCILYDFKTEVESSFYMNDIDELDDLDKKLNSLKQKLEKIDKVTKYSGYLKVDKAWIIKQILLDKMPTQLKEVQESK